MSTAGCLVPGFHRQFGLFDFIRKRSESRRVLVDNEETSDTQVEQYTTSPVLCYETCTLDKSPLFKQPSPPITIFRALPIRNTDCTYIHYIRHIDNDECTIPEATHSKSLCNSTAHLLNGCCSDDAYVTGGQSDLYISNGRNVLSTADGKVGICRCLSSANENLSRKNANMDRVVRCKSEGNFDLIKPEGVMLIKSFRSEHEIRNADDATASAENRSTDRECDADVITHAGDTLAVAGVGQDSSYDVLSRAGGNVLEADGICEENQRLIPKSITPDEDAVFNVKASRSEPVSLQNAARNALSLPTKLGTHFVEKTAKKRKSKLKKVTKLFKDTSGTDGIEMETFVMSGDKNSDNKAELTSFIRGKREDSGSLKARWKRFRSEKSCKIEPESITRMLNTQAQCVEICQNVAIDRGPGDHKISAEDGLGEPKTIQKAASTLSMTSDNLAETSEGRPMSDDVTQRPSSLFIKTSNSQGDLRGFLTSSVDYVPEVTDVYESALLICTEDKKANKVTTASRLKLYISGKTKSTEEMGSEDNEGVRKTQPGKRSRMKSYHSQPELRTSQVEHQGHVPVLCQKSSPEYIVREPVIKKSPQTCEQNAPLLRLKNRLFKQKAPLLAGGKLKFNLAPPSLATTAPYKVKVNTPRLHPCSQRQLDG